MYGKKKGKGKKKGGYGGVNCKTGKFASKSL